MNVKNCRVCLIILTASLFSCAEREKHSDVNGLGTADPYETSFFERNVKYMIKKSSFGYSDTIFFDRFGNIIEIQGLGRVFKKRGFDSNHNKIRDWVGEDIQEHYLVSYDTVNDMVVQKWTPIKTAKWDYGPEDLIESESSYAIFIFNKDGRFTKEINLKDQFVISCTYDQGLLTEKEKYDLVSEMKEETIRYFYEENVISRIEEYYPGRNLSVPNVIHYFTDGRLDFSQSLSPEKKVTNTDKYEYVYYE